MERNESNLVPLDLNQIPPCEGLNKEECTEYNPPLERYEDYWKDFKWYNTEGFKGNWIYKITWKSYEDPSLILIELFTREWVNVDNEDIEKNLRYVQWINQIWDTELLPWEIISIEIADNCHYQANIWKDTYIINIHQYTIKKVS